MDEAVAKTEKFNVTYSSHYPSKFTYLHCNLLIIEVHIKSFSECLTVNGIPSVCCYGGDETVGNENNEAVKDRVSY